MKLHLAAFAFSLSLCASASAHPVIGVTDGDTLTVQVNQESVTLRLANIDAPEKGQPFGRQARESLSGLCLGKDAEYTEQGTGRYGELLATVTCNGVDVSRTQIERGLAWVIDKSNQDFTLPALQSIARRDRKGLWADADPVPPWTFRRPRTRTASMRPPVDKSDPQICFVDQRGEYRIVAGTRRRGC